MPRAIFPHSLILVPWFALLTITGCGSRGPEVYQVTGVALRGGQPLSQVKINFQPVQGRSSWGYTDDEGRFELNFSRQIPKGALPGEHKVWVAIPEGSTGKRHPQTGEVLRKYGHSNTPMKVNLERDGQFVELHFD